MAKSSPKPQTATSDPPPVQDDPTTDQTPAPPVPQPILLHPRWQEIQDASTYTNIDLRNGSWLLMDQNGIAMAEFRSRADGQAWCTDHRISPRVPTLGIGP